MIWIKRVLRLLCGESGPTLQPTVAPTRPAYLPKSAATLFPRATGRFGHYQIMELLGRSPGGAIYRARDDKHAREVALKILDAVAHDFPLLRAGLETEAHVMAALNHPNVQQVYELGEELSMPYLAVELVRGTSLKSAIQQGIGLKFGLRVLVEALAGLAHVHQRRVVHRRIEPVNIVIQERGPAKIVGFDIAVPFQDSVAGNGRIVGTPGYMSPEQAQGRMLDGRSDLFSVGCILYELVTGRPPFQAETVAEMLEKINRQEPEMSDFAQRAEWEALGMVTARALRRRADDRFVDAMALSAAVTGALQPLRDDAFPRTQRWH